MHIEIKYADGCVETLKVRLEGEWVSSGGHWIPGHNVENPRRCHFQSDYFGTALDEGGVREGREAPEEGEGTAFEPFQWKLVGTEEDVCREMLASWRKAIGPAFDPLQETDQAIPDAPNDVKDGYRRDRQCWMTYLDDPAAELITLEGPGSSPRV